MEQAWKPDFYGVEPPAVLLCALSGGADSIALTHAAQTAGYRVYAAHLNHGLRGDESERDEAFVRQFCRIQRLPLLVERTEVGVLAKEQGIGIEESGRNARYAFLEREAARLEEELEETVWIVTAHTLSDQAETVLMNLLRGCGLTGLIGIPPRRGRILRPLLGQSRKEVEAYCAQMKLGYVVDSTNGDVRYTRNRLRQEVLPILEQINPAFLTHVKRMTEALRQDEDCLQKMAVQLEQQAAQANGWRLPPLRQAPPAVRVRVLKKICQREQIPLQTKRLGELQGLLNKGNGTLEGANGKFFALSRGMLKVRVTADWKAGSIDASKETVLLPPEGVFTSGTGKRYKIQTLETLTSETFHKVYKNIFDIWMDCGKICGSVQRRTRLPADRIKLAANRPTKSLKKLLSELAVPLSQRARLFVLADEQGVIAVEGVGIAARVACDAGTRRVLHLAACSEECIKEHSHGHGAGHFKNLDR